MDLKFPRLAKTEIGLVAFNNKSFHRLRVNPDVTFMTSSNIAKPQAQRAPKTTYRNSVYAPMVGLCSCAHRGEKAIMIGLHGHQAPQKCHIRVNFS